MRIVAMKGSCGIAAGAGKVYDAIVAEIAKYNDVELGSTADIYASPERIAIRHEQIAGSPHRRICHKDIYTVRSGHWNCFVRNTVSDIFDVFYELLRSQYGTGTVSLKKRFISHAGDLDKAALTQGNQRV